MSSALVERTNVLLDAFENHQWKAYQLRDGVPLKSATSSELARLNQDGTPAGGEVFAIDPDDKDSANHQLKAFKDVISTLKFAYLESTVKLQFVNHIMQNDEMELITKQENAQLEQERLEAKGTLQLRKRRAAELEHQIRQQAEVLGERLAKRDAEAAKARELVRECEAMETEIALLKNKRTPAERVTIEESYELLDHQASRMAAIGPATKDAEAQIKRAKADIRAHKQAADDLARRRREMQREMEDREAKGNRNERAEEGCRWITSATALYSALLGIRAAYAVGSPPSQIVVEYDALANPQEGDVRTLSIQLGPGGEMVGAELVNSSESIQDIVDACLPSQDRRGLVQLVRARIGR